MSIGIEAQFNNNQCQDKNECSDKTLPLHLISPKSHAFLNSQYANEAHKLRKQEQQFVLISPADADARQISEGDSVRIFNQLGEVGANARVTTDVSNGTVVATFGYWPGRNLLNGSVNALTKSQIPGFAGTPYYNDTLVEIEKLPKEAIRIRDKKQ